MIKGRGATILGTLVAGVLVAADAQREGAVRLTNGDHFNGQLFGFESKQGWQLRHESVKGEMLVKPDGIARLSLKPVPEPPDAKRHSARVRLVNGDELPGEVLDLNEKTLTMETWFAGRLVIPRAAVTDVSPGARGQLILGMPDTLKGWGGAVMGVYLADDGDEVGGITVTRMVEGKPAERAGMVPGDVITHINDKPFKVRDKMIRFVKSHEPGDRVKVRVKREGKELTFEMNLAAHNWKLEDGVLESTAAGGIIGREINWPKQARVDFDLGWTAGPNLDVLLRTDKLYSMSGINGYSLRLMQTYAYLYRYQSINGQIGSTTLGNINYRLDQAKRKARITILMDEGKKSFALLLNDKLVKTWRDNGVFMGKGKALQFVSQGGAGVRISNLSVRPWNGRLPGKDDDPRGNPESDFVMFANDDTMSGTVTSLKNGQLGFKTEFAEMKIDLARIRMLRLARKGGELPKASAVPGPNGRFSLIQNGRLTLSLQHWDSQGVRVNSPLFGPARLSPAAVNLMQFK